MYNLTTIFSECPEFPCSAKVESAGCLIHFDLAILKDNDRTLKMKNLYMKDDGHRLDVRTLMALPYVPSNDIERVFKLVTAFLQEKSSKAVELLPRLEKYFVRGYVNKNGGKVEPRFPPSMWSVHNRIMADQPATTNFLEGSHRGYTYKFIRSHPDFLHFGQTIAKDVMVIDKGIMLVSEKKENLVQKKRQRERTRMETMKNICEGYSSNYSADELMEYLQTIARVTSRAMSE